MARPQRSRRVCKEPLHGVFAPEGGCLANLGAHNVNKPETHWPHHHPNFNVDEDAFELGSALYAQYAINYLNK